MSQTSARINFIEQCDKESTVPISQLPDPKKEAYKKGLHGSDQWLELLSVGSGHFTHFTQSCMDHRHAQTLIECAHHSLDPMSTNLSR